MVISPTRSACCPAMCADLQDSAPFEMTPEPQPAIQPDQVASRLSQEFGSDADAISTAIMNVKLAAGVRSPDANLIQKNIDTLVAAIRIANSAAPAVAADAADAANAAGDIAYSQDDPLFRLQQILMAMGVDPATIDRILNTLQENENDPVQNPAIEQPDGFTASPGSSQSAPPVNPTQPWQPAAQVQQSQPAWQAEPAPLAQQRPESPKNAAVNGTRDTAANDPASIAPVTADAVPSATNQLSQAALAANPTLRPYARAISDASKAAGIPVAVIGAQIWAESRGNPNTDTVNGDGSHDHGLMQIGAGRLGKDNLSAAENASIVAATGKNGVALDVYKPAENVMAGAFHLKYFIGQNNGDLNQGLAAYVGRDPKYVSNVHTFIKELEAGKALSEDAGTPI